MISARKAPTIVFAGDASSTYQFYDTFQTYLFILPSVSIFPFPTTLPPSPITVLARLRLYRFSEELFQTFKY